MNYLSNLRIFLVAGLMAFIFSACENDYVAPTENVKSIPETLQSFDKDISVNAQESTSTARRGGAAISNNPNPTFFTLLTALKESGLLPVVARNELTVFAPTDAAFAELGLNPSNIGDVPNLQSILLYHVVGGSVFSTDLSAGYVGTLNGASARISLDDGVQVNDANVILADIKALNGVIHAIDAVLLPPTLVDIVTGNENFSILQEALETAGLVDVLANMDAEYTVFAPTNAAFAALLDELGVDKATLLGLPNLDQVLLYHVTGGAVTSDMLSDGLEVEMASGGTIEFDLSGAPSIIDANGREVTLNTGLLDIKATNGVVHVIDGVLLP